MGIDIYARYEGMSEAEKEAQMTGWSTWAGDVGYLREAYHGGPYATKVLVPEAFVDCEECCADEPAANEDGVIIPAAVLRERLPATLEAARDRNERIYSGDGQKHVLQAFRDFVALVGRWEAEGKTVRIVASY